jgi:hypothetical protein
MTAATPSTDRPSRSSVRDDPAAIDEHTFATPAFPFDAGPHARFPAPLGGTDADLGHVCRRAVASGLVPSGEHARSAALMESSRRLLSSPFVAMGILAIMPFAEILKFAASVLP